MPTQQECATQIKQYFAEHAESGEFCMLPREEPFRVVGYADAPTVLIYTTKCSLITRHCSSGMAIPDSIAMVGRTGLPAVSDLAWIQHLAGTARIAFLGDLDVVDLMIYAWLDLNATWAEMQYLGLSDCLLMHMPMDPLEAPAISTSSEELEGKPLLISVLPNLAQLVGPKCWSILDEDRKIEIEGALSMDSGRFLASVFQLAGRARS